MVFLLVSEVSKVSENLSRFILLSSLVFGFATNQKARMREKNQDRKSLTPLTSLTGVVATVTGERYWIITANRTEIINGDCCAMVAFKAGRGVCKRYGVHQRILE
jgi:hypothetical protein